MAVSGKAAVVFLEVSFVLFFGLNVVATVVFTSVAGGPCCDSSG